MDLLALKQTARSALSAASYPPGRLALFHTGAALLLSLVTTLIGFALTRVVDSTGGLAGLGSRTVLETVRMLLILAGSAAIPFWDLGYLRAALCTARGQNADLRTLPEGFRRFGISLRLMLLRTILCTAVAMVCFQIATFAFMLSPLSMGFYEQAQQLLESADAAALSQLELEAVLPTLLPLYAFCAVVLLAVLVPILYRLRLADWSVMDEAPGALAALIGSFRAMKGKRLQLLRLDLSFWWYYGLQLLAAGLASADLLLPLLGIRADADTAFWVFYLLSLAAQLVIGWRFDPQVRTAYALAYDNLRTAPQPKPRPVPENLPWD